METLETQAQAAVVNKDWEQVTVISSKIKALGASNATQAPPAVVATPSYIMWGFGVMLYELAVGSTLFRIDVREEAVDDDELAKVAEWSNSTKKHALGKVKNKPLRQLLSKLLEKDPDERPGSWDDVIKDLNDGGDIGVAISAMAEMSKQLNIATEQLSKETKDERAAIRNLMLDLEKVKVPCLFEIVKAASANDIAAERANNQAAAVFEDAKAGQVV